MFERKKRDCLVGLLVICCILKRFCGSGANRITSKQAARCCSVAHKNSTHLAVPPRARQARFLGKCQCRLERDRLVCWASARVAHATMASDRARLDELEAKYTEMEEKVKRLSGKVEENRLTFLTQQNTIHA